jgi:hypothetical protein
MPRPWKAKSYRVVVDSQDRILNTNWNSGSYAINSVLQDPASFNAGELLFCAVESFVIDEGPSGRYMIEMPSLNLVTPAYLTRTGNHSNVLLVHSGATYQCPTTTNALGFECSDVEQILRSQIHKVNILDPLTGAPAVDGVGQTPGFTLVLVFFTRPSSDS